MLIFKKCFSGLLLLASALACSSAISGGNSQPNPRALPPAGSPAPDVSDIYRQIGLLAAPNPLAFVGRLSSFASASADTTLVLASLSIPSRALTFTREGDRYRASYEVKLILARGGIEAANVNVMEIVRVGSFRETNRTDESVIFQHYFHVPPGVYTLSATVRDVGGSRAASQQATVTVPSLVAGRLSTPTLVYEATGRSVLDSAPQLLASPRSSAVFGRDSTVAIYVEGYGQGVRLPVNFVVRNDKGVQLWRDSATLGRNGALFSGVVSVPISTVGVGIARVFFTRRDAGRRRQRGSTAVRELWGRHSPHVVRRHGRLPAILCNPFPPQRASKRSFGKTRNNVGRISARNRPNSGNTHQRRPAGLLWEDSASQRPIQNGSESWMAV